MEANKILQSDVLDILFENRNKNYGAYELRRSYNRRIVYALTGMGALCLLFIGASIYAGAPKGKKIILAGPDVVLSEESKVKPIEEVKPLPRVKPVVPPAATIKNTTIIIEKDNLVKETDTPPDNDVMENIKIGLENKQGDQGDVVQPPVEEKGIPGVTGIVKKEVEDEYPIHVQIEAKFPGGPAEWERFLRRNLRADIPVENGAAPAIYTVVVSFMVSKDGSVTEVRSENDPGYGTAEEAVRVIKKSGQWVPAVQNGRNVNYRQKQQISFVVEES